MISGQDLPLHSQDYIHKFFEKYKGYEFLTFVGKDIYEKNKPMDRIKYFYPMTDMPVKKNLKKCFMYIQKTLFLPIQKLVGINRCRNSTFILGYGSNWVSITDHFVQYILKNENGIRSVYSYGICVDELFIHTLAINSDFKDHIFIRDGIHDKKEDRQGNLRYINWWTGNPYVWRIDDRDELIEAKNRGYLFARKFDENIDNEIIEEVISIVKADRSSRICVDL